MHFERVIRDLVVPVDTTGPWRRRDPGLANQPAIPCLACHQMHCQGLPLVRPDLKPANPGPAQETFRPSLALFDRRELESVPVGRLSLPEMRVGERRLRISPDRRQALFYQCHAPLASMQVGSGDNRTAIGVHEGLSCLACHEQHGQKTRPPVPIATLSYPIAGSTWKRWIPRSSTESPQHWSPGKSCDGRYRRASNVHRFLGGTGFAIQPDGCDRPH